MAEEWYVRMRGKVTGPFDATALQSLVRRGALSRIHEISNDRLIWTNAAEYNELFPAGGIAVRNSATESSRTPPPGSEDSYREPPNVPSSDGSRSHGARGTILYFYTQRGSTVGPVPLSVLKSLAENGTLGPEDLVWRDGDETGFAARQMPILAPLMNGRGLGHVPYSRAPTSATRDVSLIVRRLQKTSLIWYLVLAGLLFLFNALPVAIVDGNAVWWWITRDSSAPFFATTIYYLVAATTVLIISPLVADIGRPITILCLAGIATLIWFVWSTSMGEGRFGRNLIDLLAVWGTPVSLVGLLAVNRLRSYLEDGGPTSARVLQIVSGALVIIPAICAAFSLVESGQAIREWKSVIVIVYLCEWAAACSVIAAGILAIVCGKPSYTSSLNTASTICAATGGGLLLLTAALVLFLLGDLMGNLIDTRHAWAIAYVCLRFAMILTATLALLSVSLNELLVWAHRDYVAKH